MNIAYRTAADPSKISREMAEVILSRADEHLRALYESINNIGSRATNLASIYSVGSVAGIGGIWVVSEKLTQLNSFMFFMIFIFSLLWITAAILCGVVIRPRPAPARGVEPSNWLNNPKLVEGELVIALIGEAENIQDRIEPLRNRSETDARLLRGAVYLGIAAPALVLLLFGISQLCPINA